MRPCSPLSNRIAPHETLADEASRDFTGLRGGRETEGVIQEGHGPESAIIRSLEGLGPTLHSAEGVVHLMRSDAHSHHSPDLRH